MSSLPSWACFEIGAHHCPVGKDGLLPPMAVERQRSDSSPTRRETGSHALLRDEFEEKIGLSLRRLPDHGSRMLCLAWFTSQWRNSVSDPE